MVAAEGGEFSFGSSNKDEDCGKVSGYRNGCCVDAEESVVKIVDQFGKL